MRINQHPELDSLFEDIGLPYWGIGITDERTVRGQSYSGAFNSSFLVVSICSPYRDMQKYAYNSLVNRHLSYIEPFAWEVDYHTEVRQQLAKVQQVVEPIFSAYGILNSDGDRLQPEYGVDNNDNDDRAIAVAMGLGKLGRNQLVIHPKLGTHFFIGYLIYSDFSYKAMETFFSKGSAVAFELACEKCKKCEAACPTQALTRGVEHCLSYLTQFTGEIPEAERPAFQNRLYGCSECQRVCPYNRMEAGIAGSYVDPFQILMYTNKTFKRDYGHMGFAWRTLRVYKRNALINIGNTGSESALQRLYEIQSANQVPDNLLVYLEWAIQEIKKRIN